MILLALCCVVAAVFAWFVIPGKKPLQQITQVPAIPTDYLGPEDAKMSEKLAVLQRYADKKQKEKQVETVVKEFQELLK